MIFCYIYGHTNSIQTKSPLYPIQGKKNFLPCFFYLSQNSMNEFCADKLKLKITSYK